MIKTFCAALLLACGPVGECDWDRECPVVPALCCDSDGLRCVPQTPACREHHCTQVCLLDDESAARGWAIRYPPSAGAGNVAACRLSTATPPGVLSHSPFVSSSWAASELSPPPEALCASR